jgi:hypothetical protein
MKHLLQHLLFLLIVAGKTSFAWIISSPTSNKIGSPSNIRLFAVEIVSVESLTDHEKEGTLLAESVARWLDSEVRMMSSIVGVILVLATYCVLL